MRECDFHAVSYRRSFAEVSQKATAQQNTQTTIDLGFRQPFLNPKSQTQSILSDSDQRPAVSFIVNTRRLQIFFNLKRSSQPLSLLQYLCSRVARPCLIFCVKLSTYDWNSQTTIKMLFLYMQNDNLVVILPPASCGFILGCYRLTVVVTVFVYP